MTAVPALPGRGKAAPPWRGAVTFGGLTFVASLLVAIPMVASRFGGDLADMPSASAEVLASAIEAKLARDPRDPATLARLDRLSRRELAMRPGAGAAWLRRAAIDFQRDDVTAANLALDHSLAVAPLQTSLFMSRARLAYEHWPALTPSSRQQVMYQARIEYARGGEDRLKTLANEIRDPSGRIGLAFLIVAERTKAQLAASKR